MKNLKLKKKPVVFRSDGPVYTRSEAKARMTKSTPLMINFPSKKAFLEAYPWSHVLSGTIGKQKFDITPRQFLKLLKALTPPSNTPSPTKQ